jgi:hypothetical protein
VGTSVPDQNKFAWQRIIHEALVELDPEKLKGKVAKAEAVIFERMQDLGPGADHADERHALQDASNSLLTLKKEVLKFPDWRQNSSGGVE